MQYDISTEHVFVSSKPTDCEFMHAPLGNKDCHYEKQIGLMLRSRDGSVFNDSPDSKDIKATDKVTDVYVNWVKVAGSE